jgi:hypothetical protein
MLWHLPATGIVADSPASLFISKQFQGRQFGTGAMDLLERVAVSELGAKLVTLDTVAYRTDIVNDGKQSYAVEDFSRPGRTIAWYQARGYSQFRVSVWLVAAVRLRHRWVTLMDGRNIGSCFRIHYQTTRIACSLLSS